MELDLEYTGFTGRTYQNGAPEMATDGVIDLIRVDADEWDRLADMADYIARTLNKISPVR